MTRSEAERLLAERLPRFGDGITSLLDLLGKASEVAEYLPDQVLLTVAAWIEHGDPLGMPEKAVEAVRGDCKRRAKQGRAFAGYLDKQPLGDILRRVLDHL